MEGEIVPTEVTSAFLEKAEAQLRALFIAARASEEVQFALALAGDFRGMQDAGWSTAQESRRSFEEYLDFIPTINGPMRARVALSFYCHIAEAAGFYEVLKNMLRRAGGEFVQMMPFSHLTERRKQLGNTVAPNCTKVFRDMAAYAEDLGMTALREVLTGVFNTDIRNGYAHANYVIRDEGINLPGRQGGIAKRVTWAEFDQCLLRAISSFDILRRLVQRA